MIWEIMETIPTPRQERDALLERKWDLLEEVAAIELAIAALKTKLKEEQTCEKPLLS
jgi:hypothetical protein